MSEVELGSQERLKCDLFENILHGMIDDCDGNGEPSGDEIISENGGRQEEKLSDCDVGNGKLEVSCRERKRKHRRPRRPKWRPYCSLSWDERREVDERDAKRSSRVRAVMCANGHTLAPCNTTQFLMADHSLQEPDYHSHLNGHKNRESCTDPLEEFYSSPDDEEDFLQKQFTETYENIHAERLSNMTQSELVLELMNLEDRAEELQKRLLTAKEENENVETGGGEKKTDFLREQVVKLTVFREEIQKLTRENEVLRQQNASLRTLRYPGEDIL